MFDEVPQTYQSMTQTLYDYNVTIYQLEGIGILFIVLRSMRIFNILLQHLLPFKLIVLFKPATLNLYYFCGLVLVTYLRFGTSGTQIPYAENNSTNGKYYYFLGTNSDSAVDNQQYLNANYTSVLLHDCDFTLFLLLLLCLFCIPYLFTQWPKQFKEITILFIEGSMFELTLGSVGQIAQTIYNKSTTPMNIIFSIIGGLLLIFCGFIAIRPILAIKLNYKCLYLNFYANSILEKGQDLIFLCFYFITLINELIMGILPTVIGNFKIIFYIEIGVCGVSILLAGLQIKSRKIVNGLIILLNGLLIASYVLIGYEDYQYAFIIVILLSCHFVFGLSLSVMQIIQSRNPQTTITNTEVSKQPLQSEPNAVNIELQSISLQLEQSQQQVIPTVLHSKFMLTSQISNIKVASQFNSHSQNTSTEIVKEENLIHEKWIQRQQCLQVSQFFDNGYVKLNKLVCQFKFNVKVFNKIHEIDPKILKRNNIGNKVKGIHTFILRASENCEIEEMQLKTYFSDQLLQRDIKVVNKQLQIGQSLEIVHEHIFEQSDSWNEKLTVKITVEGKAQRFSLCNSELKLFQVMPLPWKSLQKMMENGVQKYVLLHEQRLERFNFDKVTEYCKHYGLFNHKLESAEAEYRNQELCSNFGKVQLILPGTPYIRLILSIEQQVNRDNIHSFIEPNIDLTRMQYIMISVFAKKSSHQLTYGHKRICEYFGQQLINYFNQ